MTTPSAVSPAGFGRKPLSAYALLAISALCLSGSLARAAAEPVNLLPNGTLELDADKDAWPDKWARGKGGVTWVEESGSHFLRLAAASPGQMIMLYQRINVPAGVKALELSWKQRVTGLKIGAQVWFDARIMLDFKDEAGTKLKPAPAAPSTRKSTEGWVTRTIKFPVPDGAAILEIMPTLFQVETGTFDLDDLSLTPAELTPVPAPAK